MFFASHPVWVRGLKLSVDKGKEDVRGSHPVWVRGLKQYLSIVQKPELGVAPRVGAWIETDIYLLKRYLI